MEKAAELQCALDDRAAARRLHQELAEMDREHRRWAGRFKVQVRPQPPVTRTSPVQKRPPLAPMGKSRGARGTGISASSWVIDDLGMRGIIWQQSYLSRKSPKFYRGAARDNWEYDVRDEAVLLGADGEPIIISNMGEDWIEIGAAWQAMEDASTRANAKVQIRAIAPFDSDMSQEEMASSLRHFCETILEPLGLPYSAVIHRPPELGDQRNFHPHLAFSLRSMRRIEPYCWEVADEVRGELDGKDGVQMLRHLWAHSLSETAEKAQRIMRYTGLGYGARGLDLDAGEHLGEGRAAMVRRGENVAAFERNRIKAARNAARRAIRDADKKIAALTKVHGALIADLAAENTRKPKTLSVVPVLIKPRRLHVASSPPQPSRQLASVPRGQRKRLPLQPTKGREVRVAAQRALVASTGPAHPYHLGAIAAISRIALPGARLPPPASETASGSLLQLPDGPDIEMPQRLHVATEPSQQLVRVRGEPSQCPAPRERLKGRDVRTIAARALASSTGSVRPDRPGAIAVSCGIASPIVKPLTSAVSLASTNVPVPLSVDASPPRITFLAVPTAHPVTNKAVPSMIDGAALHTAFLEASSRARELPEVLQLIQPSRGKSPKQDSRPLTLARPSPPNEAGAVLIEQLLLALRRTRSDKDTSRPSQPDPAAVWDQILPPEDNGAPAAGQTAGPNGGSAANGNPAPAALTPSPKRNQSRPRHQLSKSRLARNRVREAPEIDAIPARDWFEANPLTPFSRQVAQESSADRGKLARLVKSDAYVMDLGAGVLEIHPGALKAIGANEDWAMRANIQQALTGIRADQQQVVEAMAREVEHRPLAFAKSGSRFWPRDLAPEHLLRLDRWAADPGFSQEIYGLEQRIYRAHVDNDREKAGANAAKIDVAPAMPTKLAKSVSDGFGGWRDTPAPIFTGEGAAVQINAFDPATGNPTEPLLILLKLAGEHPSDIVLAADERLMALNRAPEILAPLLHGWRNDERVAGLVIETVRESRLAGRPVWPRQVAAAVTALVHRDRHAGMSNLNPQSGNGRSR